MLQYWSPVNPIYFCKKYSKFTNTVEPLLWGQHDERPPPLERPLNNANLNINVLISTPDERLPLLKGHFSDAKGVTSQEGFHCKLLLSLTSYVKHIYFYPYSSQKLLQNIPCWVGSVGSVSASRTVGREFASRPGHTKDHHKNGTNCLPA